MTLLHFLFTNCSMRSVVAAGSAAASTSAAVQVGVSHSAPHRLLQMRVEDYVKYIAAHNQIKIFLSAQQRSAGTRSIKSEQASEFELPRLDLIIELILLSLLSLYMRSVLFVGVSCSFDPQGCGWSELPVRALSQPQPRHQTTHQACIRRTKAKREHLLLHDRTHVRMSGFQLRPSPSIDYHTRQKKVPNLNSLLTLVLSSKSRSLAACASSSEMSVSCVVHLFVAVLLLLFLAMACSRCNDAAGAAERRERGERSGHKSKRTEQITPLQLQGQVSRPAAASE